MTLTQPGPCPWQSLSRSLVSTIVLSTIVSTIQHSFVLFLIKELNAVGAQEEVQRLGRLINIADQLRGSWKTIQSTELSAQRLPDGAPIGRYISIKTLEE